MYRLLIVDDEEMITDGLYEILAGCDLDLDLCKAYSGREALSWLHQTRVDIVLSDIRMPGIDGMQLLSIIKRNWPHCRLIFLTGYSDFDSVYRAIQTPDVQYLLKSEGYPKVIQAVGQAVAELDDSLRVNGLIQRAQEKLKTLEVLARGEYFRHLLHGASPAPSLAADFLKLNIPLDADRPIYLAQGDLSRISSAVSSYANRHESAMAIMLLAESLLNGQVRSLGMIDRFGDPLWLIQESADRAYGNEAEEGASVLPYLVGQFELIQSSCSKSLDLSVAVTLADRPCDWTKLSGTYDKMKRQRQIRTGDGAQMVQTVNMEASCCAKERSPRDKSDALSVHLDAGRRDEFLLLFDELTQSERDNGAPYLLELYYTISLVLLSYVNRWELENQVSGVSALMRHDEFESWKEAFAFLRTTAMALFELRSSGESNRAAEAILKVRAYIEGHLDEDLSLVRLAGYIHFNPSYLSRLFKQECGVNLSEYIEAARIERAKELLRNDELKVLEVGVRVGYEASQSFTRFFKKTMGVTPVEYRDASRTVREIR
ncbi:response regulator transcription factor [Paenibacillus sacheonensis]|uniref:Response regulator n=1 Tax=Paenibacillus sacheonensis TaxID=742054 RepID=A0A7X4YNW1_9BACL|nr:helix-turn-helix domain-containing protein [Paenibacillus sacheonensis]MBM7565832.1 two-component system response regulator YesN [Paenibacillus sacheonensis]NBC68849.1 response regulator [Paenibacillus sacheonensis]